MYIYIYIYIHTYFGRGDLGVCPLGGFAGAQEHLTPNWSAIYIFIYRERER